MIRFELKLIPVEEAANEKEKQVIASSNALAEHSFKHFKKLVGQRKCRKHPSSPNKIRIHAVKGGDPKAELVAYCCPAFFNAFK